MLVLSGGREAPLVGNREVFPGHADPTREEHLNTFSRPSTPNTVSTPACPQSCLSFPCALTRLQLQTSAVREAHGGHAVSGFHVQQDLVILREEEEAASCIPLLQAPPSTISVCVCAGGEVGGERAMDLGAPGPKGAVFSVTL